MSQQRAVNILEFIIAVGVCFLVGTVIVAAWHVGQAHSVASMLP